MFRLQVVCYNKNRKKGSGLTIHCIGRSNSGKAKKASKNAGFSVGRASIKRRVTPFILGKDEVTGSNPVISSKNNRLDKPLSGCLSDFLFILLFMFMQFGVCLTLTTHIILEKCRCHVIIFYTMGCVNYERAKRITLYILALSMKARLICQTKNLSNCWNSTKEY